MIARLPALTAVLLVALSAFPAAASMTRTATVEVDPTTTSWERVDEGVRLLLEGGVPAAVPGAFDLPALSVTVRPPEGMRLVEATATALGSVPLVPPRSLARVPGDVPETPAAEPLARAGLGGYRRGERVDHVILHPAQPAGRAWTLATRVSLTLRFESDDRKGVVTPLRGPRGLPEAPRGRVVDFRDPVRVRADAVRATGFESTGARYPAPFDPRFRPSLDGSAVPVVMVTGEALRTEVERLAAWRTRGGTPAVVRTVEWIESEYPEGVDRAEKIRLFLRDAVTYWGTEWVLLAGDSEVIPMRYARIRNPRLELIPSDLYYQGLDGNWNANGNLDFGEGPLSPGSPEIDFADLLPEVSIGRFPVSTVRDAQVLVDKVLAYETNPPVGDAYPASALLLAEVIFPQTWAPGQTIDLDGTLYTEDVANRLPPSFLVRKLYENFGPFSGAEPETLSTVSNALNAGYGIVHHVGHGYVNNMSMGLGGRSLEIADADALSNGQRTFFLYSVNCTSSAVDFDAIGEHFLKNAQGGAVGVVGSTRFDYTGTSRFFARRFYERVFEPIDSLVTPDLVGRAGWALSQAKSELALAASIDGFYRWTEFTLTYLGDPQLRLWTAAPGVLFVQRPNQVPAGESEVVVTASEGGLGVPFARVTWHKDGETLASTLTDERGEARLTIRPLTAGTIQLTVIAPQRLPFLADVPVVAGASRLVLRSTAIDDSPQGNGDGRLEAGERARVTFTCANTGPGPLTGLLVSAASSRSEVSIAPLPGGPASLAAGDSGAWVFDVTVEDSLTAAIEAVIALTLRADQGTWADLAVLYAGAPDLAIHELRTVEVVGDGNGRADPGEVVEVVPVLFNRGSGESLPLVARATLEIDDGSAFLVDSTSYAPVASGETATPSGAPLRLIVGSAAMRVRLTVSDAAATRLSEVVDLTPPSVPTAPEANGAESRILVSWSRSTAPDVARYVLYRGTSAAGPFQRVNGYESFPMLFHADEGLPGFTEFWYRVAAQDSSGNVSAPSVVVRGTTSLPLFPNFPLPSGLGTTASPAVADLDGDGRLDVIAAREEIYAFHLDGTELRDGDADARTLGPWSNVRPGAGFFGSPAVGDLDGDGRLEVVAVSFREGRLFVWERNGRLLPGWPRATWVGAVSALSSPCLADLTGDGLPEIIVQVEGAVYAFDRFGNEVRDGDHNPATRGVFLSTGGKFCYGSVAAANLDSDGKAELVVPVRLFTSGNEVQGRVYVIDDDGTPLPGWPLHFGGDVTSSPALADLDGDGTPEILFATGADSMEVRRLDGTSYPGWPRDVLMNQDVMSSPAVADLDGDGNLEIVVVGGSGKLLVWEENGAIRPGFPYQFTDSQGRAYNTTSSPSLANLDTDPELEIVYGNQNGWILAVEPNGTLAAGFPLKVGGGLEGGVLVDDIDQDGVNEIVVTSLDQSIFVYRTTGTPVARSTWPMFRHDPRRTGAAGPSVREALEPRMVLGILPTIFVPESASFYLVASRTLEPGVTLRLDGEPLALEVVDASRVFYRAGATVSPGSHTLEGEGRTIDGREARATRGFAALAAPSSAGWTESALGVRVWTDGASDLPPRLFVSPVSAEDARVARDLVPPGDGPRIYVGPDAALRGETRLAFDLPARWISARVERWTGERWVGLESTQDEGRVQVAVNRLGWFRLEESRTVAPASRPALAARAMHPNPFASATSLDFTLSAPDRVTVDVFDLRGARVRRVLDASLPSGDHHATWDGRDEWAREAVPGVYFVRISGSTSSVSRKVVRVGGNAP